MWLNGRGRKALAEVFLGVTMALTACQSRHGDTNCLSKARKGSLGPAGSHWKTSSDGLQPWAGEGRRAVLYHPRLRPGLETEITEPLLVLPQRSGCFSFPASESSSI